MYDTWMYDGEESYLIISVCYWTKVSGSWWDDKIMRLIVDLILYIVELWCHSRLLSIKYAKECSYGSSHLSISNWLVVLPFYLPYMISHIDAVL